MTATRTAKSASKSDLAWATAMGLSVAEFRKRFKPWVVRANRAASELPAVTGRIVKSKPAPSTRQRVIARDGHRCRYCLEPVFEREFGARMLTIDHVIPLSRGGTNGIDNLVVACQRCNQEKADLLASEWQQPVPLGGTTPLVVSSMPSADCPDCESGVWADGNGRACPTCDGVGVVSAERAIMLLLEARDRAASQRHQAKKARAEAKRLREQIEEIHGPKSARRDLLGVIKRQSAVIQELSDAVLRDKVRIAKLGGDELERLIPNPSQRERALTLVHPRRGVAS